MPMKMPMKMEPTLSSETSAIRTQTPGNYPKRNKLQIRTIYSEYRLASLRYMKTQEPKAIECSVLSDRGK